jgi:hypothetical protein
MARKARNVWELRTPMRESWREGKKIFLTTEGTKNTESKE